MFRAIKLWFTARDYYYQRKRFMKLQKTYRKKLKKLAKEFCPWSGYYMHEVVKTMLEFYYKTYAAKDCCWSESAWDGTIAESLKKAVDASVDLDSIEDLDYAELIKVAEKDGELFYDYVRNYEDEVGYLMESEALLSGDAYSYLEKKYTVALYNIIGNHIWEWCD